MVGMVKPITHLNYPLDFLSILDVYKTFESQSKTYKDMRNGQIVEGWKTLTLEPYLFSKIFSDFNISGVPRIYHLMPFAQIPEHKDFNTLCSLNFIINDDSPAPVLIEGIEYSYTQAVLNTQRMHAVNNGPKARLLFKISIYDKTYEQLIQEIPFKKL